jgi:hypothetical protein
LYKCKDKDAGRQIFSIGERMAAQGKEMVQNTNNIFKLLAFNSEDV